MAQKLSAFYKGVKRKIHRIQSNGIRIPIATKLVLFFLLVIVITSAIFTIVGIRLIGNRIIAEAQEKVRNDLNAAREIYLSNLRHINDVVSLTADRFFIAEALLSGNTEPAASELLRVKQREGLDILTLTDASGKVLMRTSNLIRKGDDQSQDELVKIVLEREVPVASTEIISSEELSKESSLLTKKANFKFLDTPMAREREETEETAGMMLKAAAPVLDENNQLIGVIYGGVLLNRNFEIVDKIKDTVFENVKYKGQDIGTATIFQDGIRVSTNVKNEDGSRAIGTRVTEEVYNQVVINGQPWIDRAYVVNNWYITAHEPIRGIKDQIIGILYVGILEQKYLDIKTQTSIAFLAISLVGALVSMVFSYFIAQRISVPINKLVSASREVARGNLDARVEIKSNDELGELAETFNVMAMALQERDEKLKEFTRNKIMESERLALIGQLSANVAHELNNPLQGIVTYSHLLLEDQACDNESIDSIKKIVIQANRCRDIIRGLLDFSRQRKPDKTLCDVNYVLTGCVSLLENQAIFHNIHIVNAIVDDLPLALIDPSQIERVFINLIINAAEAMDGTGILTLATRSNKENQSIEVEITDNGQGIDKQNLERIFDPFFTTKDTGHGVGLGLAISYGIVKEHNGTLTVKSELGKGTTFILNLPVATQEEIRKNGR
jgi:two-component system NtrC family sensor kinase